MSNDSGLYVGAVAAITWLVLVFTLAYGWISNIITLYHSNFSNITGELILRVIGIFIAPLGAVLGYL